MANTPRVGEKPLRIALVVVGNEVLSGDTKDTNGHFLASRLAEMGHELGLIVTIPDCFVAFSEHVKPILGKFDVIVTSGGIGPTPDDITRECIARILGRRLVFNEGALKMLEGFYGERLNENARRMAELPEGCELVMNERTGAPGFHVENVYCFAGVPAIFREMFEVIAPELGTRPVFRREFTTRVGESRFSHVLREAGERFPGVRIGSYPKLGGEYSVKVVLKGDDETRVEECCGYLKSRVEEIELGGRGENQ